MISRRGGVNRAPPLNAGILPARMQIIENLAHSSSIQDISSSRMGLSRNGHFPHRCLIFTAEIIDDSLDARARSVHKGN